jgi:photosystem II stability/assembly factor-like uncharacterized protein
VDWEKVPTSTAANLHAIHFRTANLGLVVGDSGTVLKTENGGMDWTLSKISSIQSNLNAISFASDSVGYAVSSGGDWLKTTDGGSTWNVLANKAREALFAVTAFSEDIAFGVGAVGTAYRRDNISLTEVMFKTNASLFGVLADSVGHFVIVGEGGQIYLSSDIGYNFNGIQNNEPTSLFAVCHVNSETLIAAGERGKILRSTTGGKSWSSISTSILNDLQAIHFPTSKVGYILGGGGIVLKTEDAGVTWIAL